MAMAMTVTVAAALSHWYFQPLYEPLCTRFTSFILFTVALSLSLCFWNKNIHSCNIICLSMCMSTYMYFVRASKYLFSVFYSSPKFKSYARPRTHTHTYIITHFCLVLVLLLRPLPFVTVLVFNSPYVRCLLISASLSLLLFLIRSLLLLAHSLHSCCV